MQSIQSIDIRSCAKIVGATYGAMGLLFCPLLLIAALGGVLSGDNSGVNAVGALLLALLLPILYGGLGFLMGALGAWVYNIVASTVGGIQIELRDTASPSGFPTGGSLLWRPTPGSSPQ